MISVVVHNHNLNCFILCLTHCEHYTLTTLSTLYNVSCTIIHFPMISNDDLNLWLWKVLYVCIIMVIPCRSPWCESGKKGVGVWSAPRVNKIFFQPSLASGYTIYKTHSWPHPKRFAYSNEMVSPTSQTFLVVELFTFVVTNIRGGYFSS